MTNEEGRKHGKTCPNCGGTGLWDHAIPKHFPHDQSKEIDRWAPDGWVYIRDECWDCDGAGIVWDKKSDSATKTRARDAIEPILPRGSYQNVVTATLAQVQQEESRKRKRKLNVGCFLMTVFFLVMCCGLWLADKVNPAYIILFFVGGGSIWLVDLWAKHTGLG